MGYLEGVAGRLVDLSMGYLEVDGLAVILTGLAGADVDIFPSQGALLGSFWGFR